MTDEMKANDATRYLVVAQECDHNWINQNGKSALGWMIDRCSKCGEERA